MKKGMLLVILFWVAGVFGYKVLFDEGEKLQIRKLSEL
jgi:hypothetical protein